MAGLVGVVGWPLEEEGSEIKTNSEGDKYRSILQNHSELQLNGRGEVEGGGGGGGGRAGERGR